VASLGCRAYVSALGRKEAKPLDDTPQVDKFKQLARELEADEDEDAFKAKLRQIAKAPKLPPRKTDDDKAQ
jgi:hypothetical protein